MNIFCFENPFRIHVRTCFSFWFYMCRPNLKKQKKHFVSKPETFHWRFLIVVASSEMAFSVVQIAKPYFSALVFSARFLPRYRNLSGDLKRTLIDSVIMLHLAIKYFCCFARSKNCCAKFYYCPNSKIDCHSQKLIQV